MWLATTNEPLHLWLWVLDLRLGHIKFLYNLRNSLIVWFNLHNILNLQGESLGVVTPSPILNLQRMRMWHSLLDGPFSEDWEGVTTPIVFPPIFCLCHGKTEYPHSLVSQIQRSFGSFLIVACVLWAKVQSLLNKIWESAMWDNHETYGNTLRTGINILHSTKNLFCRVAELYGHGLIEIYKLCIYKLFTYKYRRNFF